MMGIFNSVTVCITKLRYGSSLPVEYRKKEVGFVWQQTGKNLGIEKEDIAEEEQSISPDMSPEARKKAQLENDALFVGMGRKFRIWEPSSFDSYEKKAREYLNKRVPEEGLQTEFKGKKLISYAKEFFNLSKKGLVKRNYLSKNGEFDESIHMKDLEKNLENGFSPADCLINKFNSSWSNSLIPIYKELIF